MTTTNAESEGDIDTQQSRTVTEIVTPAPSSNRTVATTPNTGNRSRIAYVTDALKLQIDGGVKVYD